MLPSRTVAPQSRRRPPTFVVAFFPAFVLISKGESTNALPPPLPPSFPTLSTRKTHPLPLLLSVYRCAKASLLLTGDGTQGVGFRHEPDWDVYKSDDWGRRREVLRRLVNAVGTWIARRRAGRRLAAIQV